MNILVFSSLLFSTNSITALYKEYYVYSLLFLQLTVTSILFHLTYNFYINILDKISILCIVFYGSILFYDKFYEYHSIDTHLIGYRIQFEISKYVIILSFLLTLFLFIYGYWTEQYCYDKEENVGNYYHFVLHCLSSIGHHCIIFL